MPLESCIQIPGAFSFVFGGTRTRTTRSKGICQPFKALTCWRSADHYYNIRTWHNHTSPTIAPHLNKGSLQMAFSLYQCAFASCPMMMMVWGS
jgi:hypothetical protein